MRSAVEETNIEAILTVMNTIYNIIISTSKNFRLYFHYYLNGVHNCNTQVAYASCCVWFICNVST